MAERDLLDRLEKAMGPSRELDGEIAKRALSATAVWSYDYNCHIDAQIKSGRWTKPKEEHPDYDPDPAVVWRYSIEAPDAPTEYGEVPCYTASLDAAIALVERCLPGWSWECRRSGTGDQGQATVWNPSKAPGRNDQQRAYNCPSPQIALLIALFRARLSRGEQR